MNIDRDEIIKDLGINNLSIEDQNLILNKLEEKITEQINLFVLSSLTEEEKVDYQDEAKAQTILTSKLTNDLIKTIAGKVIREFKPY